MRRIAAVMALLIMAGPATAAFADGGPDRVLPKGQQVIQTPRSGFADRIQPPRVGFGDRIQPVVPAGATVEAPSAEAQPVPAAHGSSAPVIGVVAGLTLLTAAGLLAVARRKRIRLAHTG